MKDFEKIYSEYYDTDVYKRQVKDYVLTRYACYLIAQNGDPKKEEIAFVQNYFPMHTRKQELIDEIPSGSKR